MSTTPSGGLRHNLHLRLATTFALFGILVSLLLATGILVTARQASDRLMDETLRAELDDYLARRARNPTSLPPATLSIRGYVYRRDGNSDDVPRPVLDLPVGKHQLTMDGVPYRVSVADRGGERYVMMFNEARQRQREERFLLSLLGGVLVMTLVSAATGWWLAGRIVAPVAELARLISATHPGANGHTTTEFSEDEVGKLARGVFGEYIKRMGAFISREQAFTTDVSHELRTPLAIVRSAVELMEDNRRLEPQDRERVARIRRAVDGMIDVTSALLMMAREDSLHEPAAPCDVCSVVRDAVDAHRHLLSAKTSVELECRGHPRLAIEATLLKIVVANLVLNAFSHTEAGSVTVVVDDQGVAVSDTGSGIRGDDLGKVFQKHFKGEGSTGSGIGLSLVKRICDRYGWEMTIASSAGHGTTARLIYAAPESRR